MDKQTILKQIIEEQLKGKSIELVDVDPAALANTIMEEARAMATPLIQESLKDLKIKNANEDEILEKATEIFVEAINKSIDEEITKLKSSNDSLKNLDLWGYMAKKFAKPTEKVVQIINMPTSKTEVEFTPPTGVFQVVAKDGYDPNTEDEDEESEENESVFTKDEEAEKAAIIEKREAAKAKAEADKIVPNTPFKTRKWGRGMAEFGDFRLGTKTWMDDLDWEPVAKRFVARVEKEFYKGMKNPTLLAQFQEFLLELLERGMVMREECVDEKGKRFVRKSKCYEFLQKEVKRLGVALQEFNDKEDVPEIINKVEEVTPVEVVEETVTTSNRTPQEALKKLDELLGIKSPRDTSEDDEFFNNFNNGGHDEDVITIGDNPSDTPVIDFTKKETPKVPETSSKFSFAELMK